MADTASLPPLPAAQPPGFSAFISYRHAVDSDFAAAFELALKRYARGPLSRPRRLFRDEQHLRPGQDLPSEIRQALVSSDYLILLASPEAAASHWVKEEIDIWCGELQREKRVIIVLTSGKIGILPDGKGINWEETDALPTNLKAYLTTFPLWVDLVTAVSPASRTLADPLYKASINAVVARLEGVEPNQLIGEEWRLRRRNIRMAWGVAGVLALLLFLAVWLGISAETARQQTEVAREQAVGERNRAQRALSQTDYRHAAEASKQDRDEEALAYLARAVEGDPSNELATSRILNLLLHRNWPQVALELAHGGEVVAAEFSIDGRRILTGSSDGTAKIWDAGTGALLLTLTHGEPLLAARFSPDGRHAATGGGVKVRLWDAESGRQVGGDLIHDHPVYDLAFEPDGSTLATACAGSPRPEPESPPEQEPPNEPETQPEEDDGIPEWQKAETKRILARLPPGYAQLWEVATGKPAGGRIREGQGVTHLAWHPGERLLALGAVETVQIWDVAGKRERFPIWTVQLMFSYNLSALRFDASGRRLLAAAGSRSDGATAESGIASVGTVEVWDTVSGESWFGDMKEEGDVPGNMARESWVRDAAFIENGYDRYSYPMVASATDAGEVAFWHGVRVKAEGGSASVASHMTVSHELPLQRLLPSPRGQVLTVAGSRAAGWGYARLWGTGGVISQETATASGRLEHDGLITAAAWAPGDLRVLTAGSDGMARVWWAAPRRALAEKIPGRKTTAPPERPYDDDSSWEKYTSLKDKHPDIAEADATGVILELPEAPVEDARELPASLLSALAKTPAPAGAPSCIRFLLVTDKAAFRAFRSLDSQWLVLSRCGNERDGAESTVWRLDSGKRTASIPTEYQVQGAAFAADTPPRLALATGFNMSGTVQVFAMEDGRAAGPPIKGPGQPIHVTFSRGARRVAVSFGGDPMLNSSTVGIYDVETALPLVEPIIRGPLGADSFTFTEDDRLIVAVPLELGGIESTDVPAPAGISPSWLPELARVAGRRELDAAGNVVRIRDLATRRKGLLAALDAAPPSDAKTVAQWWLAPSLERPVSPRAKETTRARLETDFLEWQAELAKEVEEHPDGWDGYAVSGLQTAQEWRIRTCGDPDLAARLDPEMEWWGAQLFAHVVGQMTDLDENSDPAAYEDLKQTLLTVRGCLPANAEATTNIDKLLRQVASDLQKLPPETVPEAEPTEDEKPNQ